MTSRTRDCAPKPIATPRTPRPAISGPIWTPNAAERHHRRKYDDDDEQDVAKDRQQGAQPRPPPGLVGVRLAKIGAFGELAIDRRLHGVPQQVGDEQDDDGAQYAIGEAAD